MHIIIVVMSRQGSPVIYKSQITPESIKSRKENLIAAAMYAMLAQI